MNEKEISRSSRTEMAVFLAVSFGIGIILGFLIHYKIYNNVNMISKYMMLTPAVGGAIGKVVTSKKKTVIRTLYLILIGTFTAASLIMLISIFGIAKDTWLSGALVVVIIVSTFLILRHNREGHPEMDLFHSFQKGGKYLLIYFLTATIAVIIMNRGNLDYNKYFFTLVFIAPSFLLQGALFLGEELGWRGYLQPFLQKRIGKRMGVVVTGLIWQLWHLPFFYTTEWDWRITAVRFLYLVSFSIFLGYVYMKTQNIWMPAMLHFLHNTVFSFLSVDVTRFVVGNIILSCIWGTLLFTSEYQKSGLKE